MFLGRDLAPIPDATWELPGAAGETLEGRLSPTGDTYPGDWFW
jgi:hypothetical protein